MDSFEDALDRLDMDWWDVDSIDALREALSFALRDKETGAPGRFTSTMLEVANIYAQTRQQQITDLGFNIGQFARGGVQITQLRDERGRFVTSGAANITARLAEEVS